MKNLALYILLFFAIPGLSAQEASEDYYPKDEPYPAPVSYANLTEEEAEFLGLFDSENVGNLHVWSHPNPIPDDAYYFKGQPIPPNFIDLLPNNIARLTHLQAGAPHAVMSIRSEGEELYLLRLPGEQFDNQLGLYDLENGALRARQVLASYNCSNGRCVQRDSWIQDVNGDTRLDIITKEKVTRRNGKKTVKTTVFLMDNQGYFKKARHIPIQEKNYLMQEISSNTNYDH